MALKYDCPQCGSPIILKFLKIGDKAWCKKCGAESVIPESVITVDEEDRPLKREEQPSLIKVQDDSVLRPPLMPFDRLITLTFSQFKNNIQTFLILAIAPVILGILANMLDLPLFFGHSEGSTKFIYYIISVVLLTLATIVQIPIIIAAFKTSDNGPNEIKHYYFDTIPLIIPYLITMLICIIMLALSAVCLIIPAIIVYVMLNFAVYFVVIEHRYYFKALSASRDIVKNRWWKVFLRIILPTAALLLFSMLYGFITPNVIKFGSTIFSLIFFIIMGTIVTIISILNIIFEITLFKDLSQKSQDPFDS